MYEFLEGTIETINPAYLVLNNQGIGYHILISVNTYEKLKGLKACRVMLHQTIREDAHLLYGFFDATERELFRLLITVNGVGSNTARMILSGQSVGSIVSAISTGNINLLKSVKGVGPKTAQRIIIELQEKVGKLGDYSVSGIPKSSGTSFEEAMKALMALGFARNSVEKTVNKISESAPEASVEDIIKASLKLL